jgi:hypothetical protein
MVDYARTGAVKEAVQARLLLYPGVHAVGIGPKITGGRRTDEPSIMVFLVRKRPPSELAPEDLVPAEIDGVKTDIIEMGVPRTYATDGTQVDRTKARPLVGGVLVQSKGGLARGTLGCFATTKGAQSKVVAITCHHVTQAAVPTAKSSVKLTVLDATPHHYVISFAIQATVTTGPVAQQPVATGSVVQLQMAGPATGALYKAWWTVTAADTAATIAGHLIDKVNATTARSGITAASGTQPASVVITCPQGGGVGSSVVYDPVPPRDDISLTASVADNVVTLAGQVSDEYCAYINWNTDGADPSQGLLTLLAKDTPIAGAISAIADSIANFTDTSSAPEITPAIAGDTITLGGAAQVSCYITDPRIGQPDDDFSSDCSLCCANEIGRVLDADLGTDTALVQVRRGMQYRNEILHGSETVGCTNPSTAGNSVIMGVHPIFDEDVAEHYPVQKQGITTGFTQGIVISRDITGSLENVGNSTPAQPVPPKSFARYYHNALGIQSVGNCEFASGGDSGAPVFDALENIVGIVFGGSTDGHGNSIAVATPIDQITARFNITIATSTAVDEPPQTVTDAQGAPRAVVPADDEMLRRVLTTRSQITATPAGRRYAELITRHAREVQDLINDNRRVTVAWHRNGGPEILRAVVRFINRSEDRLPAEIGGVPLAERLARIGDALADHGSPQLSADLARYGTGLIELTRLSYDEALDRMRSSELAAADAE